MPKRPLPEHPWFGFGKEHDLPIESSHVKCLKAQQLTAVNLARQHGFEYALHCPTRRAAARRAAEYWVV
jgi:hypothetical protein